MFLAIHKKIGRNHILITHLVSKPVITDTIVSLSPSMKSVRLPCLFNFKTLPVIKQHKITEANSYNAYTWLSRSWPKHTHTLESSPPSCYLPDSFNLPNENLFLLQAIKNSVLGGIKENKIGESNRRNNKKFWLQHGYT